MSDVKDQTLQCINNDLVSTAEFLHDISSNPKKLECLTMFIDCHSIIEWIKSVTSGTYINLSVYVFTFV